MNQQQVVSPPQLISQDQIARRFMTKLAWLMAGGMFIDGFVLGYLGALMPSITADLHLSTTWQGLMVQPHSLEFSLVLQLVDIFQIALVVNHYS